MFGRPSRRSRSGWETLPEVWKWLETVPEVRKWLGDPPGGLEVVRRPSRRCVTDRETLPEVWKWLETPPEVRKWSGDPPGGTKWSETLPKVWNWSRDPSGSPEVVGRPSRRSGSGGEAPQESERDWKTLSEVRKWSESVPEDKKQSGDPPGGPEVVGRPARWSGSGRETFP